MVAADLVRLICLRHARVRVAHDGEVVAVALERRERARAQVEVAPDRGGCREVLRCTQRVAPRRTVHHFDAHETRPVDDAGHAAPAASTGHHSIEEREGYSCTYPLQEGAAIEVLTGYEVHFCA